MYKEILIIVALCLAGMVVAEAQGGDNTGAAMTPDKGDSMGGQNSSKDMTDKGNKSADVGKNETGLATGTKQGTKNAGEESQIMTKEQVQAKVQEIRGEIAQMKEQLQKQAEGAGEKVHKRVKNQNEVRVAVHALKALGNVSGGIGPQVSEIARNFENLQQASIKNEEKIEERGGLSRFFAGGDHEAAKEMQQIVQQNREKIQELKQLKESCDCTQEVKEMMQEQIQVMEQEQERLQQKANNEIKSKGLLGWIWK